jgi:hypothetical protein
LAAYLRRRTPDIKLFYAEPVWEILADRQILGALALESELAKLADLVIIIVESPGTFAELGAFSNTDDLRAKLLAIVDDKFKPPQKSFIALGPIQWIEAESFFKPTIYAPLESILSAVGEVQERISRIKRVPTKVSNLAEDPKHLLLFICDLVSIIYPTTAEIVEAYFVRIATVPLDPLAVVMFLALGKAMGILDLINVDSKTYYFPARNDGNLKPYHHLYLATLPGLRSEHIVALQSIPTASSILQLIWGHDAN